MTPDATSYRAFLRILAGYPLGATVSINHLHDDIEAAQIPASARGACFKAAAVAGYLRVNGATTAVAPEARGRLVRTYMLVRRPGVVAA